MQQELAAVGDGRGQPPARASDDLSAFLDGLATAWQNVDRPPQGRKKATTEHWWRSRVNPFEHSWSLVEGWLQAQPSTISVVVSEPEVQHNIRIQDFQRYAGIAAPDSR